jgi:hypothetical protein
VRRNHARLRGVAGNRTGRVAFLAMTGKRIGWIIAVLVALLVYAWIDGGEEPLRPIVEPIAVPENAQ